MRLYILKICIFILALMKMTACSNDPIVDFGEQYKKTIYIVKSEGMLYVGKHSFEAKDNYIEVSVYCASSEPIKSEMSVTLKVNPRALDSLNRINALASANYEDKILLPENNYTLEGTTVTIKSGAQYGLLRIPINPKGLDSDLSYALPITIVSNTANYEVNKKLETIVYELKMVNEFSGYFSGNSKEFPDAEKPKIKPISSVVLQAMSSHTVRMPIHTLDATNATLDSNYMILTIASDNIAVTISPWRNAQITDLGGSTYNSKQQSFSLNYSFVNSDGKTIEIEEKIRNLDAPPIVED